MVSILFYLFNCTAAKLWEKGNWMNHQAVPLNDFMTVLYDFTKPQGEKEVYTKCISQLFFPHDDTSDKEMSLENFAKLLKWFGPLKQGEMDSILEIIFETVRQPWFFGVMSREEAETRLDHYKVCFVRPVADFARLFQVITWSVLMPELPLLLRPLLTLSPEYKTTPPTHSSTFVSNHPGMVDSLLKLAPQLSVELL